MFSFQSNLSFGAVQSADEKHLSADTNVVGIAKYLITKFCKTRSCVQARTQKFLKGFGTDGEFLRKNCNNIHEMTHS